MSLRSGLAGQIGYKLETTWGTFVAPTRFIPLISEDISEDIDVMESEAIVAGALTLRSAQWALGNVDVSGGVKHELFQVGAGLLFRCMFGGVTTTGAGPYVHTFTPEDLADDHMTVQVGVPDVSGTVQPFSFYGMKVQGWELGIKAGELVTLDLDLVGKKLATSDTLATASFTTGAATPFTFKHASATIGGAAANIKELTLKGDNGLDTDRRFIGSEFRAEPLSADSRAYTGEMTMEFESLTQMNRWRTGTEAALVATITAGASASLVVTTNARFDGSTPTVDGKGIVELKVPFKCIGPTTDASAITAVLTNTDATPT